MQAIWPIRARYTVNTGAFAVKPRCIMYHGSKLRMETDLPKPWTCPLAAENRVPWTLIHFLHHETINWLYWIFMFFWALDWQIPSFFFSFQRRWTICNTYDFLQIRTCLNTRIVSPPVVQVPLPEVTKASAASCATCEPTPARPSRGPAGSGVEVLRFLEGPQMKIMSTLD